MISSKISHTENIKLRCKTLNPKKSKFFIYFFSVDIVRSHTSFNALQLIQTGELNPLSNYLRSTISANKERLLQTDVTTTQFI